MENQEKPKRQLTEAQRLAFLKAREKRLANIEKKKQDELENVESKDEDKSIPTETIIEEVSPDIPQKEKPKRKYTRKKRNVKEEEPSEPTESDLNEVSEDIETMEDQTDDINQDKNEESDKHPDLSKEVVVDHDLLAERIIERMQKLDPPPLKRETATRRPKPRLHATTANTPPQVFFNWM